MSILDPIDHHYQVVSEMEALATEYDDLGIRSLTSSFAGRVQRAIEAFDRSIKLLPSPLSEEVQRIVDLQLHPQRVCLQVFQDVIKLFGFPGDRPDAGPDWGGGDDRPDRKPSPHPPTPIAA